MTDRQALANEFLEAGVRYPISEGETLFGDNGLANYAAEAAAKVLASNWSDAYHDAGMAGDPNHEMLPGLLEDVDEAIKALQAWKEALKELTPEP